MMNSFLDPIPILFILIIFIILFKQITKIFRFFYHYPTIPDPKNLSFLPLYKDDWKTLVDYNRYKLNPTKNSSCCICLETFTKQKISYFPVCGKIPHLYCRECILEYGNTIIESNEDSITINCPICKTTVWTTL